MKNLMLFGEKIKADKYLKMYMNYNNFYEKVADEYGEGFEKMWSKCRNIHEALDLCNKYGRIVIAHMCELAVVGLTGKGIYEMDEESFYAEYKDTYLNLNFMNKWKREYESIAVRHGDRLMLAEVRAMYNEIPRSSWSGGGFGIKGALKGAAVSTVFNTISSSMAESRAKRGYNNDVEEADDAYRSEMRSLFKSPQFESDVKNGMRGLYMNGMYAFLDELEDRELFEYPDIDSDTAETIAKNTLKWVDIEEDRQTYISNFVKCITLNPLEESYYLAFLQLKDLTDEELDQIREVAEFFGLGESVEDAVLEYSVNRLVEEKISNTRRLIKSAKKGGVAKKALNWMEVGEIDAIGFSLVPDETREEVEAYFYREPYVIISKMAEKIGEKNTDKNKWEIWEAYQKQEQLSEEEKEKITAVLLYSDFMEKWEFHTSSEYISMEEIRELIAESEILVKKMGITTVFGVSPLKLESYKLSAYFRMYEVDTYEGMEEFISLIDRSEELFLMPFLEEEKMNELRESIDERQSIKKELEKLFQKTIQEPAEITYGDLKRLTSFVAQKGVIADLICTSIQYRDIMIEAVAGAYEKDNVWELRKKIKTLEGFKDSRCSNYIRNNLKSRYEKEIAEIAPISKYKSSGLIGLQFYADLSQHTCKRSIGELKDKAIEAAKKTEAEILYETDEIGDMFQKLIESCLAEWEVDSFCGEILVMYVDQETHEGFMVTDQGILYCYDEESAFVPFEEMLCLYVYEEVLMIDLRDVSNKMFMVAKLPQKKLDKILSCIRELLLYMYDLPTGNYDEDEVDMAHGWAKDIIENADDIDIDSFAKEMEVLESYQSMLPKETVDRIKGIYSEKQAAIMAEAEELIAGYEEKSAKELDEILIKLRDSFPKPLNRPYIKTVDEQRRKREKDEIASLINGWETASRDKLCYMLRTLEESNYSEEYKQKAMDKVQKRIVQVEEEKIKEVTGEISELDYWSGMEVYAKAYRITGVEKELKEKTLNRIKNRVAECGHNISKDIIVNVCNYSIANECSLENFQVINMENRHMYGHRKSFVDLDMREIPILVYSYTPLFSENEDLMVTSKRILVEGKKTLALDIDSITGFGVLGKKSKGELYAYTDKGMVSLISKVSMDAHVNKILQFLLEQIKGSAFRKKEEAVEAPEPVEVPQPVAEAPKPAEVMQAEAEEFQPVAEEPEQVAEAPQPVEVPQPVATPQSVEAPQPVATPLPTKLEKPARLIAEMTAYVNQQVMYDRILGTMHPKFPKKVVNAIGAYAPNVLQYQVFALFDDTVFGSGKNGFLMTPQGIYISYFGYNPIMFTYEEITEIYVAYDGKLKLTRVLINSARGCYPITSALGDAGSKVMARTINQIVKYLYGLEEDPYPIKIQN